MIVEELRLAAWNAEALVDDDELEQADVENIQRAVELLRNAADEVKTREDDAIIAAGGTPEPDTA